MKWHGRMKEGKRESGFTLIEVMIAMAILGIGLMSIAVAQLTAIKVSSRSKNLQQAMFLAREQMDDLEALPPGAALLQVAATTDDAANPIALSTNDGNLQTFTRSVTVTPNTPEAGLSQVVVTVSWDSPQAGIRQVQLTSVKRAN